MKEKNKRWRAGGAMALLAAIALFGGYLMWSQPGAALRREVLAAEKAAKDGALELSGAWRMLGDMEAAEACAALVSARDGMRERGESTRSLAVLAASMVQAGRMTQEEARRVILPLEPITVDWLPEQIETLPELLELLDAEEAMEALILADVGEDADKLSLLGDAAAKRLSPRQIAEVDRARREAGKPADRLVMRGLSGFTQEEIVSALATEADLSLRDTLAEAYGKVLSLPEDVLDYLAAARAVGVPATACYPEGARVRWDLSGLDSYARIRTPMDRPSAYLILRCTEAEEEFEYRDVPGEIPLGDGTAYEGGFAPGYESNNGRWLETVTVVIDTAVMDEMPPARIPAGLAELDALVVFDTRYVAYGVLRFQSYAPTSASKGRVVQTYRDYLTYGVMHLLDVYDGAGRLNWRFDAKQIEPPQMETRRDGFQDNRDEAYIARNYLAAPDTAWMEAQEQGVIDLLRENGWDLWQAIEADGGGQ